MIDLGELTTPYGPPAADRTSDGSEMFPYLWRYFLNHEHIRNWLMRTAPYTAAAVSPRHVSQGVAFCCNFAVPSLWSDMAACFDLGEMFIPDHAYDHFMCGSVVAATPFHKHLVCALGPAASRHPSCLPSYRAQVRRMVVDMGSSRSINVMEFSWMEDGALIVTCKVLVPPDPAFPHRSAGCTGAFALFTNVIPGGSPPRVPRSLVSFVEAPRCPLCLEKGSLGCYCSNEMLQRANRIPDDYSSAVWPPILTHDVQGTAIDTFHNIRSRLTLIKHIAHVKITAHVVIAHEVTNEFGRTAKTYTLGPSRFVIRSVLFRPSNSFESDTLRQVADKLRRLRTGSLSLASSGMKGWKGRRCLIDERAKITEVEEDESHTAVLSSRYTNSEVLASSHGGLLGGGLTVQSSETSRVSAACGRCGQSPSSSNACETCVLGRAQIPTGNSSSKATATSKVAKNSSVSEIPAKRITCNLCRKTFSQQGSLNRHLKNIHEEKKIPCQFCTMTFGQMFDLRRHQKRKHADKYISNVRRERVDVRSLRTVTPR